MMKAVRCHRFAWVEEDFQPINSQDLNKHQQTRAAFRKLSIPLKVKDCLELETIPCPSLSFNDVNSINDKNDTVFVLIETEYAGVQYPDYLCVTGTYQVKPPLPYIPGMDVVGKIVKIVVSPNSISKSSSSTSLQVGDRVMATLLDDGGTGGLAELVFVSAKHVYKLPSSIPPQTCANIGRNYFAAYHSLVTVLSKNGTAVQSTKRSDSNFVVLVTGSSGGVGMATIELAKAMKYKVIAGVSTMKKSSFPKQVGADVVLIYGNSRQTHSAFKNQVKMAARQLGGHPTAGVDLVVDMVQGDLFEQALLGCVCPLGTIALVGFAAGQKLIRPGLLLMKEINVVGSLWGRFAMEHPQQHRRNVEQILKYLAERSIRPRVDRVFPLHHFMQAFEVFEENRGRGNTVVSFVDQSIQSKM